MPTINLQIRKVRDYTMNEFGERHTLTVLAKFKLGIAFTTFWERDEPVIMPSLCVGRGSTLG